MANAQALYTLDTNVTNNWFSGVWKLTRAMKAAGWTYMSSGDGNNNKEVAGVAANDLWGGNVNPMADTFPTAFNANGANTRGGSAGSASAIGGNGPWIVLRGPSILKFPIGSGSTGTFFRNEQVSQATSGATGEIIGYVFDATNLGWVVVKPRTGTFDGTHVLTGATSGASVTPTSLVTYLQEVVVWKSSGNGWAGHMAWTQDVAGNLFSDRIADATGYAPPGFANATNFPPQAIVLAGQINSLTHYGPGATITGNATMTNGSTAVSTTSSQSWSAGDILIAPNQPDVFYTIVSGATTSWVIDRNFTGTTFTGPAGRIAQISPTATLTNGSALVTGSSTLSNQFTLGDFVVFRDQPNTVYEIIGFPASSSMTLDRNYTGTGGSAKAICLVTNQHAPDEFQCSSGSTSPTTVSGHACVAAANATPSAGVSADGTFWCGLMINSATVSPGLFGLFLLDNTEPGDASPYAFMRCTNSMAGSNTYSRLGSTSSLSSGGVVTYANMAGPTATGSGATGWHAYVARGTGFATDVPMNFCFALEGRNSSSAAQCDNSGDTMRVQNHPASNKPIACDTPVLFCNRSGNFMFKGRPRWMRASSGTAAMMDTMDSKLWVCFWPNSGTTNPPIWAGPWDGVTTPSL